MMPIAISVLPQRVADRSETYLWRPPAASCAVQALAAMLPGEA